MVLDDLADGVGAAHAGVFAEAVEARLVGGALWVCLAPGFDGRREVTRSALLDDHAIGTYAQHRPDWQSVDNLTEGAVVTRVQHRARVDAALIDAGELALAVPINAALRLGDGEALDLGVACCAIGAAAAGLVVVVDAICTSRARIVVCTKIDALVVDAALIARAIRVSPASNNQTLGVAISLKA